MLKNKRVEVSEPKVLMNNRGFELGWEFFFNLLFILAIIVIVIVWIIAQSSGAMLGKQVLAKEICILATEAKPDTVIMADHAKDITIEKKDSGVIVKQGPFDPGYFYDCYLQDNVKFSRKDNITIIEIK